MSTQELTRKGIMEQVKQGHISLTVAAKQLGISYRQSKRIKARYLAEGDRGLLHRSRGRPSGRELPAALKQQVLSLYRSKYSGFGPTLASEFMAQDDQVMIHAETLRLWLKSAGLWTRHRRRKRYRQRRAAKERFGELLQIDGSDHHWFGQGQPRCCLLNMVDDATGTTLARLADGETTHVLLTVLMTWIKRYGVPQAVYVDLKSVYVSKHQSVFQSVCQRLGIEVKRAYSPQAKGRVERKHGVFQDRFVKELALKGISTIEEANRLLERSVLKRLNAKFAKAPTSAEDGHRDASVYGDLDQVICWRYTRVVKEDYTVQLQGEYYQLLKGSEVYVKPKKRVQIRRHLDGQVSMWVGTVRLKHRRLKAKPKAKPKAPVKKAVTGLNRSELAKRNKHKTPWTKAIRLERRLAYERSKHRASMTR